MHFPCHAPQGDWGGRTLGSDFFFLFFLFTSRYGPFNVCCTGIMYMRSSSMPIMTSSLLHRVPCFNMNIKVECFSNQYNCKLRLSTNIHCGLIICIIWVCSCPFLLEASDVGGIVKWGKCDAHHFHPVFLWLITKRFLCFINVVCVFLNLSSFTFV